MFFKGVVALSFPFLIMKNKITFANDFLPLVITSMLGKQSKVCTSPIIFKGPDCRGKFGVSCCFFNLEINALIIISKRWVVMGALLNLFILDRTVHVSMGLMPGQTAGVG